MGFAGFSENKTVVELLQRSLRQGRLAHAYLFNGTALGPLERMARVLAKTLNCKDPVERGTTGLPIDSCDRCSSCRKIDEESHGDVHWLRPESKSRVITIDQIRELLRSIYLKPSEGEYKIAVIVAADRLNVQAANAFLKTLEEPPARSVLLLLSTDPSRLLETILSRCLRLTFAAEGQCQIEKPHGNWLAQFCEMAIRAEHGLLGRYRLLNVLLNKLGEIKAETEKSMAKRSPLERYDEVDPSLREKWEDELAAASEAEYRRQRSELLLGLEWWLRDVWLQTASFESDLHAFPSLRTATQMVGNRISSSEAVENLRILEQTQRLLATNAQEALTLEVGFLKLKL